MSTDERTTVPARRRSRAALSLPADPSDEELARDWTLSAADKVEIQGCRGDDHRLRFALQLCVLRLYGRFLTTYDTVPLRIVNHLGRQLALPPCSPLTPCHGRRPTVSINNGSAIIWAISRLAPTSRRPWSGRSEAFCARQAICPRGVLPHRSAENDPRLSRRDA
jgi:hypothetical protein